MSAPTRPASLLRSSAVMAAGTVVSRVTGFARSAVLLAVIGTSTVGDVFNLANTVPNILYILLAGGVLNSVLVPQVVRAMKKEPDGGVAYAQRLLTITVVVLAGLTLLATVAAPLVIGAYAPRNYGPDDVAAALGFAYWCLPQIFFYGLFTVTGQLLNARGRFGPMMWAPVLNNLVAIAVTLMLGVIASATLDADQPSSLRPVDFLVLGGGSTLGIALQAAVLLPVLRATGLRLRPRFDWRNSGIGRVGRAAVWTVLFVLVNQVAYLVIVRVATGAGKEALEMGSHHGAGYTVYTNAYLLFMLPHSIITVSLVTALLPGLSGMAADGRLDEVRARVASTLRTVGVLMMPLAACFIALGPSFATAAFGYGRTSLDDALWIGLVLAAFSLGLVPFSSHYTVLRGFYALEDTRTPFVVQCVIAAANVVLALAVMLVPADVRVVALALGWSGSYVVGYVVSSRMLGRRLGTLEPRLLMSTYARSSVAALVAAVPALAVVVVATAVDAPTYLARLLGVLLGAPVLLVCYVAAARRLHVQEVADAVELVRGQVLRRLPGRSR